MPPISGYKIWLDVSKITGHVDGDSIATWPDESGNGFDATAVGASPIYKSNILNGRPALRFTSATTSGGASSSKMRAFPTGLDTPYTMFVVARMNDTSIGGGPTGRILGAIYPTYRNYLLGWWNGFERVMYAEGFVQGGVTTITTNWHQYSAVGTGSNTAFYESGSLIASNASGIQGVNGSLAISGYDAALDNETSDFDIVEIIAYTSALSDPDRGAVDLYLYNKYFSPYSPGLLLAIN